MTSKELSQDVKDELDIHTVDEFCQSCAIPLSDESILGTNKDGTKSEEYCKYCYQDGEFTEDCTIEEMKNMCLENMVNNGVDKTEGSNILTAVLPHLKRWKK